VELVRRVRSGCQAELGQGPQDQAARLAARAVPIAWVPLRAAHLGGIVALGERSAWPVGTVEAPEIPPALLVAQASRFAARRSGAR
jgi:hypothetical protein